MREDKLQDRQISRMDFVPLQDLESRLPFITEKSQIIVHHGGHEVAVIQLGSSGLGQPPHFIIRPPNLTPEMLRMRDDQFVMKAPDEPKVYEIDPNGAGGHYAQGVHVAIAGVAIQLPKLPKSTETDLDKTDVYIKSWPLAQESFPLSVAGLKVIPGTRTGSDFALSNLTGTVSATIGLGTKAHNEDLIGASLPDHGGATLFVIDGNHRSGFEGKGSLAAQVVANILVDQVQNDQSAFTAMKDITARFREKVARQHQSDSQIMGACVALAEIEAGTVRFAHVGDCKGLLIRAGADGRVKIIHETRDHTDAQEMREQGMKEHEIPPFVRHTVNRNVHAKRSSQTSGDAETSGPINLLPGDLIVLMSDGMNVLGVEHLLKIIQENDNSEGIVQQSKSDVESMIEHRSSIGKRSDNFSLIVFKYKG